MERYRIRTKNGWQTLNPYRVGEELGLNFEHLSYDDAMVELCDFIGEHRANGSLSKEASDAAFARAGYERPPDELESPAGMSYSECVRAIDEAFGKQDHPTAEQIEHVLLQIGCKPKTAN
jgi:hypothetical protein